MDKDPDDPTPALTGANQNQGLVTERYLATRTPEKEENWSTVGPWGKKKLMKKDRCESKKQTLSESTQVHNPWSGWGANFEKPGGHRFTAKPDYWEKNKYSNDSKIIKLISTNVRGETQDLEGNDMSLCENFLLCLPPHYSSVQVPQEFHLLLLAWELLLSRPKCAVSTFHWPSCAP